MLITKIDQQRWDKRIYKESTKGVIIFFLMQAGSKTNNWFEIDTLTDLESHANVVK